MKEAVIFETEGEFREWFEKNYRRFGIKEIILSQEVCPDYVVKMENGECAKIEAELFAINFKYHGHDPNKVDYILACFAKESEVDGVPVIAVNRLWIYEPELLAPLPPEGPLSEDEFTLLCIIDFHGSLEISALAIGEFSGDQNIFRRVPPNFVASSPHGKFPRGRLDDSIFNVITPEAKEYLKKYHHILIGAGLSEKACECLESLRRRKLIKDRPLPFIFALHDGKLIEHKGWVPTEVYVTSLAHEIHGEKLKEWHLQQIRNMRTSSTPNDNQAKELSVHKIINFL
ncbi:hypothetical protein KJ780_03805 [Candidatus Micrarchaeota archaeon]|nr:hypothetical protein [Candidatus Micrarchaeota archaeon]